ncbi:MAG: adenylate/guanylate cyclase domain-containing protein [Actinomycetota bacterium]
MAESPKALMSEKANPGAAIEASERHAWREALELLEEADRSGGLGSDELERLGEAAWWLGRLAVSIDARERAFATYRQAGDSQSAGRVAIELAYDYDHKGSPSLSAGWLSRAERILEHEPESPDHGYLARRQTGLAVGRGDLEAALELADRTREIGERVGDANLQALGLHDRGRILIRKGDVDEGFALLEEVVVAAVSGELGPWPTGVVYCNAINICRDLADYGRAGEWTEAAERWCERQSISGFPGICRVRRAEIVRLRGAWAEAEAEARRACEELGEFWAEVAGEGFYDIGEIRRRMGDLEAAEEAFRQASELGREPEPGLALLRLTQGNIAAARSAIRAALANENLDRLARAQLLPADVEIAVVAGEIDRARATAEELASVAETYATTAMHAYAGVARGQVELAEGKSGAAVTTLRRAWQLWKDVNAPYESAQARLLLGRAFRAEGNEEDAVLNFEAARKTFDRLGAIPDLRLADELLGDRATAAAAASSRAERTFMFTDIVRSTTLLEAIGDEAWTNLIRWHDETLRSLFAGHGGEEVDHAGDGFFVAFRSAAAAIDCAVAVQRRLAEQRTSQGFAPLVRIGLHTTTATRSARAYRGKGVHEAARVAEAASGDEIVATSNTAADSRFPLSEARSVQVEGIAEPLEIVSIEWVLPVRGGSRVRTPRGGAPGASVPPERHSDPRR